jgi:hypothetical protein
MGDWKFFALIGIVAVGGYFAFFHMDWNKKGGLNFREKERPTITFVPEGTPGAKTWDQIQRERKYRR